MFRLFRHVSFIFVCVLMFPSVAAQESTPPVIFGQDPNASCANARLRVGDLANIDSTIAAGVERATAEAQAWESDARLWTLRLGCPLLSTGVKWEGVFFSESAQSMYATDSGRIEAVEEDPDLFLTLDPSTLSMHDMYLSLLRAGFKDEMQLTPQGGVTIRYDTDALPFGPPTAPRNQVYAHMAIDHDGKVTDIWISVADGTPYQYGNQGQG